MTDFTDIFDRIPLTPVEPAQERGAGLTVARWAIQTWPESFSRQVVETRLILEMLGLHTSDMLKCRLCGYEIERVTVDAATDGYFGADGDSCPECAGDLAPVAG